MVIFLHFSDIHIPDKQGDLWFGVDPFHKLDNLIEFTNKLKLNPSFTIITGDISHTGTTHSYNNANKYLSKIQNIGGPVFPTMGTHDKRKNFKNILLGEPSSQEEPACYYSKTIKGLHLIAMDSHTLGSNTGSFSPKQLDWLETELKEHKDMPAVIAFHEPIFFFGAAGLFNKVDATRFRDIISAGNVLAVLNGHLHCPLYTVVDGVNYVQAGSPLWVNYYNETEEKGGRTRATYDSSSFNLLSYNENLPNRLMVRPVYFSEGQQLVDKTIETS